MFKQILIIVLIIVLSYFIIKNLLIVFHKLYLSEFVVKYTLSESDKKFIKMYSNQTTIDNLNEDNVNIFYTNVPWTTKNNNYIHDIKNDRYYIIDTGYYYYFPNLKDYQITINNKTLIINLFDNKNIIK